MEIISGALNIAKLPPSRPTFVEQSNQDDTNEPTLQKNDEVYNNLIEQVVNRSEKRKSFGNFNSEIN